MLCLPTSPSSRTGWTASPPSGGAATADRDPPKSFATPTGLGVRCPLAAQPQRRPDNRVTERQCRAHRKGQVVRRREGIRFPLARGRGRRLRPFPPRFPTESPRSRPEPGSSSASLSGRKGEQAHQVRCWTPRLGLRRTVARPAQEARGHGRHRRGPDPPARGRRAATAPGGTPTRRRASPPPSCCAAWPTSSTSSPRPSHGRVAGALGEASIGREVRANDDHYVDKFIRSVQKARLFDLSQLWDENSPIAGVNPSFSTTNDPAQDPLHQAANHTSMRGTFGPDGGQLSFTGEVHPAGAASTARRASTRSATSGTTACSSAASTRPSPRATRIGIGRSGVGANLDIAHYPTELLVNRGVLLDVARFVNRNADLLAGAVQHPPATPAGGHREATSA